MENKELIRQWNTGLRIRHMAHSRAFSFFKLWDRIIGLASALFSAIVASTVFASLAEKDSNVLIVVAGAISIVSTIIAAAYSFLKFSELSERHNQASASFGQLRRDFEMFLVNKDIKKLKGDELEPFNSKWSELEKKVPNIPNRIYTRSLKTVLKKSNIPPTEE